MSRNPRTIFEVPYIAPPSYGSPQQQLINPLMEIWIEADPIEITTNAYGSMTHFPVAVRNPSLDSIIDCSRLGNDGLPIGITIVTTSILGTWLNVSIVALPIELTATVLGTCIPGILLSSAALIELAVTVGAPEIVTLGGKRNWVKWGNIGSIDFTIWKDNIAGERPLDWKGWIYAIKKLGNKVIVYGEGGVSMLAPSGNTYGLISVYKVGLKGKQAVAGDDRIQFFVDTSGRLFSIGEIAMKSSLFESSITPERLDYSEYLSTMGDIVLSWDGLNNLLYICDGLSGYVYSPDSKSMGSGPINITGIGSQGKITYITAPSTIVNPVFEICTDIYDMGSRKNKTISTVELGTDVTGDLWVTLDYRRDKAAAFKTLDWKRVSPNGITNIPCFGVEFRIRVKRTTYAYFELDYIRVNGIVHDYAFQYPYVGK